MGNAMPIKLKNITLLDSYKGNKKYITDLKKFLQKRNPADNLEDTLLNSDFNQTSNEYPDTNDGI